MYRIVLVLLVVTLTKGNVLKNEVLTIGNVGIDSDAHRNSQIIDDELCNIHFALYESAILQEEWAMMMFDATSKIQSGIMAGNLMEMGNFKQCLSIDQDVPLSNTRIRGKYCLGAVTGISMLGRKTKNIDLMERLRRNVRSMIRSGVSVQEFGLQWAACIPDSCSAELGANKTANSMLNIAGVQVQFSEEMCTSIAADEPEITAGDIAVMFVFGILIAFILVSTVYDLYLCKYSKKPAHPIMLAFSAYTNSKKLFAISKSEEQLSCLNGIRVFSIAWVILGHGYTGFTAAPFSNGADIFEWLDSKYSMYVAGGTVSVDSFFLLSGLLISYGFLRAMSKGVKFNIVTYYLHRYIRLTPALLGIILVHLTLLKHFGSGPFYKVYIEYDSCPSTWWNSLLYLQNYVFPGEDFVICIGQSWYLAVDMQLYILSPIILIPLYKWTKPTLVFLLLLICGAIATPFAIAWVNKYPASMLGADTALVNEAMINIYIKTHCRAAPWLIGIGLGYFIYKFKTDNTCCIINNWLSAFLTGLSLAVLCTCVFAGHDLYKKDYDRFENSAYVAFVRPSWGLALGWIVYACITGQGGPINWLLSFPIFQVVGRFSYSMYLLHLSMIYATVYSRKVPEYFSDYIMIYRFWGDFIFSFALSYIWILMFESPMLIIEKIIFDSGETKSEKEGDKVISMIHDTKSKKVPI